MVTWAMVIRAAAMPDGPLFTQAPEEVTRYFDSKGLRPAFDWRDFAFGEHAHTFTVAKTAGYDVLDDIRSATSEAIRKQHSFEEFRANLQPILEDKGWWGRKRAIDPKDGMEKLAQLGSPRRLRTIHWANVATARAAGEWERTQRTKSFLPFLRYTLSNSERLRPEHRSWVGTILPVDDPWWHTHYPPNGWGCKCGVRQITRRQAEREGYSADAPAPEIETRSWFDNRNGRRIDVPVGIDPGWAQNPGRNRQLRAAEFLGDQLDRLPPDARRTAIADIIGSKPFRDMMARRGKSKALLPVAPVTDALRQFRPTSARHVLLSADSAKHIIDDDETRNLKPGDFAAAIEILTEPALVKPSSKGAVVYGISDGVGWRAALKILPGEIYLTSFHRKSVEDINRIVRRK
jgi:SPP1 gp7 family putative phage head morphogenesis protein